MRRCAVMMLASRSWLIKSLTIVVKRRTANYARSFEAPSFKCAFGARCSRFKPARSQPTAGSPKQSARREPRALSAARSERIRSPSSFHVTALFVRPERSVIIIGTRSASAPSSAGEFLFATALLRAQPDRNLTTWPEPSRMGRHLQRREYRKWLSLAHGPVKARDRRFSPRIHRRRIAAVRSQSRSDQTISNLVFRGH